MSNRFSPFPRLPDRLTVKQTRLGLVGAATDVPGPYIQPTFPLKQNHIGSRFPSIWSMRNLD